MALYTGFSSFEYERSGTFTVTDINLIKLDLVNHIYTRRKERVGLPRFGTGIPDVVFSLIDEELLDSIRDDVRTVINYDPRVRLLGDITLLTSQNTIVVSCTIQYLELNVTTAFNFNIES